MLMIVLNWLYMLVTSFGLGYGIFCFTEKRLGYRMKHLSAVLTSGLIAATVYAQIFSLFYKVGLAANAGLAGICLVLFVLCRKRLAGDIRKLTEDHALWKEGILLGGLLLVWAYFTSRGYLYYDSDLYHGQSIRWLEEYGVVKGLGNLHERFAYNSSAFPLGALYSMKFLTGRSLHAVNGFFALLLSLKILEARGWRKRGRKLLISDFARMGALYYLTLICDEVVSPASDHVAMCMIFYLVIRWLDCLEEKEDSVVPYAYLCVCGVYTMSLKLTAGLVLILLWKPASRLIREKRWKETALYLGMGLLTALPWLIRNVVISGYLLYPFPALDLFSVDWKMSAERAAADAANIKAWGRALYDGRLVGLPITEWFAGWFRDTLTTVEKALIAADWISLGGTLILAIWCAVKKKKQYGDILLVLVTLGASWLFWQTSAPLPRYGYAYMLLLPAVFAGIFLTAAGWYRAVFLAAGICGAYKLFMLAGYGWSVAGEPYYLWQQEYGTYELRSVEVDGFTFYEPVTGDRTGYDDFPAAPEVNILLRGDTLREGFRHQ